MSERHEAGGSDTRKSATAPRAERRESIAPSDDHVIVLFGATGDLAKRELLPGLFHLARAGLLPARYRIIGSARSALTDDEFRQHAKNAVTEFGLAEPTGEAWREFADSLSFGAAQPTQPPPLLDAVAAAEKALGGLPRRLFHLTVPPAARDMIVTPLFQVLGFVAMEPPTSLAAKPLRDEKTKVFEAMPPLDAARVVRGQYRG